MAEIAIKRYANIRSVTHGTTVIKGVTSVNVKINPGKFAALSPEGVQYATGIENLGVKDDFPVTAEFVFEQVIQNLISALNLGTDTLVIVYKTAEGGNDQICTIANFTFTGAGSSQQRQDLGKPTLNGVAFSADGAALPISEVED